MAFLVLKVSLLDWPEEAWALERKQLDLDLSRYLVTRNTRKAIYTLPQHACPFPSSPPHPPQEHEASSGSILLPLDWGGPVMQSLAAFPHRKLFWIL